MAGRNGITSSRARLDDAFGQLAAVREGFSVLCDESNADLVRALDLDLAIAEETLREIALGEKRKPGSMTAAEFVLDCPLLTQEARAREAGERIARSRRERAARDLINAARMRGGAVVAAPERRRAVAGKVAA